MTDKYWQDAVEKLEYAFQPIIDYETKKCYGYEALLRNVNEAGFESIQALLNLSYGANLAQFLNSLLIEKAIEKFIALKNLRNNPQLKLFFNLDSRILTNVESLCEVLNKIYSKYTLPKPFICFEITEFYDLFRKKMDEFVLNNRNLFSIAIDDFGTGFSDLKLLYSLKPEYIKIDRFFISQVDQDMKKKVFLSQIIKMVEVQGAKVVAEGVENENEYKACREAGCKLAQGFYIRRPDTEITRLVCL
jgi:EAL domain-containing protein (putative c-di-GMP-specific phosphodiesterase class I)